jgi:hypothetical protein
MMYAPRSILAASAHQEFSAIIKGGVTLALFITYHVDLYPLRHLLCRRQRRSAKKEKKQSCQQRHVIPNQRLATHETSCSDTANAMMAFSIHL